MSRRPDIEPPLRGLWITRELPFPLDSGDRIYSAGLIRALADSGAELTVTGFAPADGSVPPAPWPVRWRTAEGRPQGKARSLLSAMPLVAASHATPAYRALLAELAAEPWDFVVADQYGTGWALDLFAPSNRPAAQRPVMVHVAHDHEASLYQSLVRNFKGPPWHRLALWQNALKTARFEGALARRVDLVTAITPEDVARFAADAPGTASVVLTPGYAGEVSERSRIGAEVPRHVLMVGSYHWVAKQENLRRFVAAADPVFARHGITLHIVGSMPGALAAELRERATATVLHGFVDDMTPHFANARIAVVPEEIGGGFKLKFLDYFFARVAVATLGHAAAGLPEEIRRAMICRDTLDALVQAIVEAIDDLPMLDTLQTAALAAAEARYRWADRGQALLAAIRARQLAAPPPPPISTTPVTSAT